MTEEIILGIESSCDDTGVALVARSGAVLAEERVGQEAVHNQYGGVYPEFASRAHIAAILPAIQRAFDAADVTRQDLRAIGVTRGPGLAGPLLVGLSTATGLGLAWDLPVVGVNHLRGHVSSVFLGENDVSYPAIVLLVSGGHSMLAAAHARGDYELLGTTRDDSAGEAFDKVARMMGLPFPGGPQVDMAAARGTPAFTLPRPMIKKGLEFSFSGLKTAVGKLLRDEPGREDDVAATFVEAVSDVLEVKAMRAVDQVGAKSLIVVGGVSASRPIRKRLADACEEKGIELVLPSLKWATDNGAMIALAAFDYLDAGIDPGTQPISRIPLTEW